MSRAGYLSEYTAKKKLILQYGFHNVFKNAISNQGADYLVTGKGRLVKCVEVKECHSKKYYPGQKELDQFRRISEFCKEHNIPGELWIHYPNTRRWIIADVNDYIS